MTTRTLAEYRARLQDILEGVTYGVALDCPVCQADAAKTRALLETLPNVRFTVFSLSAERCTLTLTPGQTLTTRRFVEHSEGWSRDETAWTYVTDDGPPHVRVTHFSDGTDCDGRMTDCQEAVCPIDRLEATTNYYGDRVPDWTPAEAYHRDYAAEAAGY